MKKIVFLWAVMSLSFSFFSTEAYADQDNTNLGVEFGIIEDGGTEEALPTIYAKEAINKVGSKGLLPQTGETINSLIFILIFIFLSICVLGIASLRGAYNAQEFSN